MTAKQSNVKTYGKKKSNAPCVSNWNADPFMSPPMKKQPLPPSLSPIESPFQEDSPMNFTRVGKENAVRSIKNRQHDSNPSKKQIQTTLSWAPFKLTNDPSASCKPLSSTTTTAKLVSAIPSEGKCDDRKLKITVPLQRTERVPLSVILPETPIRKKGLRQQNRRIIIESSPESVESSGSNWSEDNKLERNSSVPSDPIRASIRKSGLRRQNRCIYIESSPESIASSSLKRSQGTLEGSSSVASCRSRATRDNTIEDNILIASSPPAIIDKLKSLHISNIPVKPEKPLDAVLSFCQQSEPIPFARFINSIHTEIVKIGEASYSEVFGYNGHVLKIIPFSDAIPSSHDDMCATKHILQELEVTARMSSLALPENESGRFVKLIKCIIVKGKYPPELLKAWDAFADEEDERVENERPDFFGVTQLYCIMILEHGGTDLERFQIKNWSQAWSAFRQAACLLALGERTCQFEHRDLHWGNILLKEVNNQQVRVTIIDYTLSRMIKDRTNTMAGSGEIVYNSFDDKDLFTGENDYQFDLYRIMQSITKEKWNDFHPLTNVYWLHYLAHQFLFSKKLAKPSPNKANEQYAYRKFYSFYYQGDAPRRGRTKVTKTANPPSSLQSACDVAKWIEADLV